MLEILIAAKTYYKDNLGRINLRDRQMDKLKDEREREEINR
jgi:4-hydroxyphenylpyruvate dioxygenase-like putative hemolysin